MTHLVSTHHRIDGHGDPTCAAYREAHEHLVVTVRGSDDNSVTDPDLGRDAARETIQALDCLRIAQPQGAGRPGFLDEGLLFVKRGETRQDVTDAERTAGSETDPIEALPHP